MKIILLLLIYHKKMFVTPKTIYRMVKKINEITKEKFGQELIISETGKGYKLNIFFQIRILKNFRQFRKYDYKYKSVKNLV